MYKGFYGLKESPFSIAPNPAFLFLSDRHREALAHLTYGLGENGGFVLLTGEVGTGKTTVSRSLLANLPEDTDVAFILNPALTELELLATLCDELKIDVGEAPTLKQLTDKISAYLQANHQAGRKTLMVIDEAQHLKPEVLEQLRLLTNLETDTRKLLQVILIGQPELQALLRRQELRQLAQRITARYHLLPLNQPEVGAYLAHRLHVAGRAQPLFKSSAVKALHKLSGGVPRVINLICERALMGGYGAQRPMLDAWDVESAAAEVLDKPAPTQRRWPAALVSVAAALGGFAAVQAMTPSAPPPPAPVPAVQLADWPGGEREAMQVLFHAWGKPLPLQQACRFASQYELRCLNETGSWQQLLQLNRPAMIGLRDEQGKARKVALLAMSQDRWLVQLGNQQLWLDHDYLARHFDGRFTLLVPELPALPKLIGPKAPLAQIQWLENRLAALEARPARLLGQYDAQLELDLRRFQQQQGLEADGLAGRQTLERLTLLSAELGPKLIQEES
ncbi:ExeA family protein [Ferrimonas marina]|uniref:General secretion pathway protein A n=1 Tax=Ferrimonas marina TaxID=299255 RepID=A0A1M5ZF80_9GAMM|nr:ExeA family protein [Ferrimonas marina]SHI22900.1 general secretion pathway protein A [Ferrimonas marina]